MKEIRTCPKCGKQLLPKNKSGYCNKHRDRSGPNNPMYGRSVQSCMTPEEIKRWKENLSKGTKRNWQKEEYRNKVISANTGKKRTEEFRLGQSIRIKQSYINNPELREQRGKLFSECWKDGRNQFHEHKYSTSKAEVELLNLLQKIMPQYSIVKKSIHGINGKLYYPDIVINDKIIVEYYGDYWHANPKKYQPNDLVGNADVNGHRPTANEVWKENAKRQKLLEESGFIYVIVWEFDWKTDKQKVLEKIQKICYQSHCSLI